MKKVIAIALTLALALSMAACSSTTSSTSTESTSSEVTSSENTSSESEAEETYAYKTGVGASVSVSPTDATEEKGASAQITTTIVAATFDAEGKIVSASMDVAQQSASFDAEGKSTGEVDLRTKDEKLEDYGMKGVSGIGKEIYEQHDAFEAWMVGKTVEEVAAAVGEDGIATDEDLVAGVTIKLGSYVEALEKAYDTAVGTNETVAKTGLGIVPEAKVVDAADGKGASFQMDTSFMVVALDENDTVLAAYLDVAQQKVAFDAEGKVSGETDLRTKIEKGDDYGMRGVSSIGKEVGEQYIAFTQWMVGKTTEEISGMATYERDESHTAVPDVEDLKSSVTITVGSYLEAFNKAVEAAK